MALSCVMLFLFLSIPVNANETQEQLDNPFFNGMKFAHVSIEGAGEEFMLGTLFFLGFGKATIIRLNLYDNALIEISELDGADQIVLEGSYTVTLWGFYGFYKHTNEGITINGVSLVAFWK